MGHSGRARHRPPLVDFRFGRDERRGLPDAGVAVPDDGGGDLVRGAGFLAAELVAGKPQHADQPGAAAAAGAEPFPGHGQPARRQTNAGKAEVARLIAAAQHRLLALVGVQQGMVDQRSQIGQVAQAALTNSRHILMESSPSPAMLKEVVECVLANMDKVRVSILSGIRTGVGKHLDDWVDNLEIGWRLAIRQLRSWIC